MGRGALGVTPNKLKIMIQNENQNNQKGKNVPLDSKSLKQYLK